MTLATSVKKKQPTFEVSCQRQRKGNAIQIQFPISCLPSRNQHNCLRRIAPRRLNDGINVLSLMRDPRGSVFVFLRRDFQAGSSENRLYLIRDPSRELKLAQGVGTHHKQDLKHTPASIQYHSFPVPPLELHWVKDPLAPSCIRERCSAHCRRNRHGLGREEARFRRCTFDGSSH